MLISYDLYDLSAIFLNVREFPDYELNSEVLSRCISVLSDRSNPQELNQFRTALCLIPLLDTEKFNFVFTKNVYVYFPTLLKTESIYGLLIEACKCLLKAIQENNKEKVVDLADCLHNLPIMIANNNSVVPKSFWTFIKYYREKWDKDFLKNEQKAIK